MVKKRSLASYPVMSDIRLATSFLIAPMKKDGAINGIHSIHAFGIPNGSFMDFPLAMLAQLLSARRLIALSHMVLIQPLPRTMMRQ